MDRKKVAAGIAARHKELLRFLPSQGSMTAGADDGSKERRTGLDYGYEFVEKFVQISVRVPRLSPKTLSGFLDNLLAQRRSGGPARGESSLDAPDVVTTESQDVRRVMEMVAPALGFNPRRLKQFLNLFRLRCIIAWNTRQLRLEDSGGWTLPQLGKIVAIQSTILSSLIPS